MIKPSTNRAMVTASLADAATNMGDAAGDSYGSVEGLRGSRYADTLTGDAGDNALNGGGRADTLAAGGGNDTFRFDTPLVGRRATTIVDFDPGGDLFALSLSIFTAAEPAGFLQASAFFTGTAAHDSDDRIIYNPANGGLMYDADDLGGAAATTFAVVSAGLALTESQFTLI